MYIFFPNCTKFDFERAWGIRGIARFKLILSFLFPSMKKTQNSINFL